MLGLQQHFGERYTPHHCATCMYSQHLVQWLSYCCLNPATIWLQHHPWGRNKQACAYFFSSTCQLCALGPGKQHQDCNSHCKV
jgi:hypothetical protein